MSGEKLTPITRKEMFLAKAAGQNIKTPEPITREEMFLSNVSGGGTSGTTDERFKQLVEGTITEVSDDTVTSIGDYAFTGLFRLKSINLPLVTSVGKYAFQDCTQLASVNIPLVTSLGSNAFDDCSKLTSINLPSVTSVGQYAFRNCGKLSCVIFRTETICSLDNIGAFNGTPFASGNAGGKLIVPRALVEEYKTATNWSVIWDYGHNRFLALEDYTVDGTITGEIDWDKLNGEVSA